LSQLCVRCSSLALRSRPEELYIDTLYASKP